MSAPYHEILARSEAEPAEPVRPASFPSLKVHAPTPWPQDLTIHLNGEPLRGVTRISFDVSAGKGNESPEPMAVRLELLASVEFSAEAVRILADAGAELAPPKASDSVRAVNQAAAYLQGILALNPTERADLAAKLFAFAGNPLPGRPEVQEPSA